jgi:hypothetical protein
VNDFLSLGDPSFPFAIEHCIQWARDYFDGYFRIQPERLNDLLAKLADSDPGKARYPCAASIYRTKPLPQPLYVAPSHLLFIWQCSSYLYAASSDFRIQPERLNDLIAKLADSDPGTPPY